ncbi:MAG: hypothetical protein ACRDKW_12545 [Actinomycetota bacterium]
MTGLNRACLPVDAVACRPAVVRLTGALPRWWDCALARLSVTLDERWGTVSWNDETGPPVPGKHCAACGRRPAIFVLGGEDPEDGYFVDGDSHLRDHPVLLCGWCQPADVERIADEAGLERPLREAAERSISWRWRRPARCPRPRPDP